MGKKLNIAPSALVSAILAMKNEFVKEAPTSPVPMSLDHPGHREPSKNYTKKNKEESKVRRKMAAKSRHINWGK